MDIDQRQSSIVGASAGIARQRLAPLRFFLMKRGQLAAKAHHAAVTKLHPTVFAVDLSFRAGFFANMTSLALALHYCEQHNMTPDIRLTGPLYGSGGRNVDWLSQYYDVKIPLHRRVPDYQRSRIKTIDTLGISDQYEASVSINELRKTFANYAEPKQAIVKLVGQFFEDNGLDPASTLGVHYRGTDKAREADRISYEEFIGETQTALKNCGATSVVVATDEPEFTRRVQEMLPNSRVVPAGDVQVGGSKPPHFADDVDRYSLGVEALFTSLVLSQCQFLLRTSSYLSGWSKVFNPDLPTKTLNMAYVQSTFPEREILMQEARQG